MTKYVQTTIDGIDEDYYTKEPVVGVDCWCGHDKAFHSIYGCRACYRASRFMTTFHTFGEEVDFLKPTR